jgi:hypothetical protein
VSSAHPYGTEKVHAIRLNGEAMCGARAKKKILRWGIEPTCERCAARLRRIKEKVRRDWEAAKQFAATGGAK